MNRRGFFRSLLSVAAAAATLPFAGKAMAAPAVSLPVGTILDFAGDKAPPGWLLCNGQRVNRKTYAALFRAVGTVWGGGDDASTFLLPDMPQYRIRQDGRTAVSTAHSVELFEDEMPLHDHEAKPAAPKPFLTVSKIIKT